MSKNVEDLEIQFVDKNKNKVYNIFKLSEKLNGKFRTTY